MNYGILSDYSVGNRTLGFPINHLQIYVSSREETYMFNMYVEQTIMFVEQTGTNNPVRIVIRGNLKKFKGDFGLP